MNLFIKSAKIIDPTSKHHQQSKDIIIEKGKITQIGSRLKHPSGFKIVEGDNLCVSPGWVDMFSFLGDPGYEYKEDLTTGTRAAATGGFTTVCCVPNTNPTLHSKSEIQYIVKKAEGNIVDVKPIGAVSRNCEGHDITEIYDMREAGAIAFSDGINSSLSAGLMLRGLLYVKPFHGLVISYPDEQSIRDGGVVNEGMMSTSLGLTGIPSVSEEIMIMRDIYLAEYTDSRVHFAFVSSAESIELIRKAKARGLKITCSVSPYNLMFDDSAVAEYDTNYKVLPPLKSKQDKEALIKALKDSTIDNIASMHIPQDIESKKVEFDYAEFGMLGLETAYAVVNTAAGKNITDELIVEKMAIAPRKILDIQIPTIDKGQKANLTIFNPKQEWVFDESQIKSKSRNSPYIGKKFKGKVVGIVNNNQLHLN